MATEDKVLICKDCQQEFAFTAKDQEFFAQKGFASDPKRCKPCRIAKPKRRPDKKDSGIYRSPAFENSAPRHQQVRNGRPANNRGGAQGPSRRPNLGEYRSPAFREFDHINPEEEYRAPGFRELADVDFAAEYRAPGFKESEGINLAEEYRSPAFQEYQTRHKQERPMFQLVCPGCSETVMVPFLPDEKEAPLCEPCYKAKRDQERAAAKAAEEAARSASEETPSV